MIEHVAEVWIALFAAFAVGSVIGWLIYRWVDRSDYAFDQRELSDALSRRLLREKAATAVVPAPPVPSMPAPRRLALPPPKPAALPPPPSAALPPVGDFAPLRIGQSKTADTLRKRLRSSSSAAAWGAAREGTPADPEPAAPPPVERRVERPPPPVRRAVTRAERSAKEGEEPWPPAGGNWPAPALAWPTPAADAAPAAPAASPSLVGPSHLLAATLPHDEIWSGGGNGIEVVAARPGKRPPGLAAPPDAPDDLQQIKGIGPTFARKLNDLGVYRYAQIAAWTPAERDWVGNDLGAQRIEKDAWIEQAEALAKADRVKAEDPPPA